MEPLRWYRNSRSGFSGREFRGSGGASAGLEALAGAEKPCRGVSAGLLGSDWAQWGGSWAGRRRRGGLSFVPVGGRAVRRGCSDAYPPYGRRRPFVQVWRSIGSSDGSSPSSTCHGSGWCRERCRFVEYVLTWRDRAPGLESAVEHVPLLADRAQVDGAVDCLGNPAQVLDRVELELVERRRPGRHPCRRSDAGSTGCVRRHCPGSPAGGGAAPRPAPGAPAWPGCRRRLRRRPARTSVRTSRRRPLPPRAWWWPGSTCRLLPDAGARHGYPLQNG